MRRTPTHQFELFSAPQGKEKLSLPQWQALPEGIRQTLSELMAQLCSTTSAAKARLSRGRCGMMYEKIRPHHLERKAVLYVRQSSVHQVLHNRESRALQYAMRAA